MPKFLKYGLFTFLTFTTSTGRTKSPVQNTSSQDSLTTVGIIMGGDSWTYNVPRPKENMYSHFSKISKYNNLFLPQILMKIKILGTCTSSKFILTFHKIRDSYLQN
jgi:hypothetical protein